jgi:DNA invertase Pin-like site-specific DNA recombinase
MAGIAQFDREMIIERTKSGLEAARSRGRVGGRPRTCSKDLELAVELYNLKTLSISEICKKAKISRSTFYAHLNKEKEQEKKN